MSELKSLEKLPRLFISYRWGDVPLPTRLLWRELKDLGFHVFIDADKIKPGIRIQDAVDRELEQTDVLLAVIGPDWVEAGRRAKEANGGQDWVLEEVTKVLNRKRSVIPVLVNGASEELLGETPLAGILAASFSPFDYEAKLYSLTARLRELGTEEDYAETESFGFGELKEIIEGHRADKFWDTEPGIRILKLANSENEPDSTDSLTGITPVETNSDFGALGKLLVRFLKHHKRWSFNVARISAWGSKQKSFEALREYSKDHLRTELLKLERKGLVTSRQSSKSKSILYRAIP